MLLAALAIAFLAGRESAKVEKIVIIPVGGKIDVAELDFLVPPLEATFEAAVEFGSRVPLPGLAYNTRRAQYLSSEILEVLNARVPVPENGRVLAITNEDLYVPDLNFVFGQADTYTGVAIISLARLRPEFYGQPPDEPLFHDRAITEAVHELGHTLGLIEHCSNPKCVMHWSNSLADTDIKGHRFCPKCSRVLGLEPRR
jgi:archaemetzincin